MFEFENIFALLFLFCLPLYIVLKKKGFLSKPSFYLSFSDWRGSSFSWKNPLYKISHLLTKVSFILSLSSLFLRWEIQVLQGKRKSILQVELKFFLF